LNDPKFVNQVYKRSREMRQQLIDSGFKFNDGQQPLFGGEDFKARAEATNQRIAMHNKRKQTKKASDDKSKKEAQKKKSEKKQEQEECSTGKSSSKKDVKTEFVKKGDASKKVEVNKFSKSAAKKSSEQKNKRKRAEVQAELEDAEL
jgi:hypothetical protein